MKGKRAKRKKIFVIDDSEWFLTYQSRILSRMGFQVIPCDNGLEAMKLIKMVRPDFIFMDIHMPHLDGVSALKQLKQDRETASIPVIIISDDSESARVRQCFDLGCAAYVPKPVEPKELNRVLKESFFRVSAQSNCSSPVPLDLEIPVVYEGSSFSVLADTLSESSIYLRSDDYVPPGSRLDVLLPVKPDAQLSLQGNVVFASHTGEEGFKYSTGLAVEFSRLSEKQLGDLCEYIRSLALADRAVSPILP